MTPSGPFIGPGVLLLHHEVSEGGGWRAEFGLAPARHITLTGSGPPPTMGQLQTMAEHAAALYRRYTSAPSR